MKFNHPDISKCNTDHLWWENEKGNRTFITIDQILNCDHPDPKQWPYAFSRFPTQIVTTIYKRRESDGGYGTQDVIGRGESGAPGDLAVRLVLNSNFTMKLDSALAIVSTACERCCNILAFENGCDWGYAFDSEEAQKSKTSCELCR